MKTKHIPYMSLVRGKISWAFFLAIVFFPVLYAMPEVKTVEGSFNIRQNPFGYRGYYIDTESALCYCQARYYSPDIMRFINRDTYNVSNRYAYCDANPIENIDPNGHVLVHCIF
jgi:RHS repeat-associated protein